jgi:hypothetical protein
VNAHTAAALGIAWLAAQLVIALIIGRVLANAAPVEGE